jgi:hypothetical protein
MNFSQRVNTYYFLFHTFTALEPEKSVSVCVCVCVCVCMNNTENGRTSNFSSLALCTTNSSGTLVCLLRGNMLATEHYDDPGDKFQTLQHGQILQS